MDLFDIPVRGIDGSEQTLAPYRGKVLLIVNVASRCGFTGQYRGLEDLHRKFGERDFAILGFPCNQFLGQEPGSEDEIRAFCSLKYAVSFPLFAKIDVNGSNAHPLFQILKKSARGTFGTGGIKWNFTKFLLGRSGEVVARFGPLTAPGGLARRIEALLIR